MNLLIKMSINIFFFSRIKISNWKWRKIWGKKETKGCLLLITIQGNHESKGQSIVYHFYISDDSLIDW